MMSERLRRRGTASTKSGNEEGVPSLVEQFESGGVVVVTLLLAAIAMTR